MKINNLDQKQEDYLNKYLAILFQHLPGNPEGLGDTNINSIPRSEYYKARNNAILFGLAEKNKEFGTLYKLTKDGIVAAKRNPENPFEGFKSLQQKKDDENRQQEKDKELDREFKRRSIWKAKWGFRFSLIAIIISILTILGNLFGWFIK